MEISKQEHCLKLKYLTFYKFYASGACEISGSRVARILFAAASKVVTDFWK